MLVGYQHGPMTMGESREGMVTPCSNTVASWLKINKRVITLISDDIVVERGQLLQLQKSLGFKGLQPCRLHSHLKQNPLMIDDKTMVFLSVFKSMVCCSTVVPPPELNFPELNFAPLSCIMHAQEYNCMQCPSPPFHLGSCTLTSGMVLQLSCPTLIT